MLEIINFSYFTSRSLPITHGSVPGVVHGFIINKFDKVVECEILFNDNSNGLIAKEILKNRHGDVKLSPVLVKNYVADVFVSMELYGFLLSTDSEVITILKKELEQPKSTFNKLKEWLVN